MSQLFTFPTVEDVLNAAIDETLGSTNRNPTALQDTALIRQLDVINRRFVNAPYREEPSEGWEWMRERTLFQTKNATTLDGAITTASTEVDLTSATDFDTSGRFYVISSNNSVDFIDYTGKSSNQLTGVTNILISHADAEHAAKTYALPTDYGKGIEMMLNMNVPYFYQKTNKLPNPHHYTTQGQYIVFPKDIGENDVTFTYEKKPTDLYSGSTVAANTTDKAKSMDIPEDFMRYAVEMLKAHILTIEGEDERVPTAISMANEALGDALQYNISTSTDLSLNVTY